MINATASRHQGSGRILYDSCPLCAARNMATVATGDCSRHPRYNPVAPPKLTWLQCEACSHIFTDGYFTDAASAAIFAQANPGQIAGRDFEAHRPIAARMIEKVLPHVQSGAWLDVGFGNGALLLTAQEYGFTPVGVDLRQANMQEMAALGVEAHCVDLAALDHPARYTVISMADVLEHMPYPKQGLAAARALLADGGLLLLSMPNTDSELWAMWNRQGTNPYWGELEHFHNFGRRRLYALLTECGFSAVRYGVSERYRCCMEVLAKKL